MLEITDYMTVEEIMDKLYHEYGEEFNWHMIPFSQASRGHFIEELKKELGEDNDFFETDVYAVAKCDSNDDVLYGTDIANEPWRIYHLTYSSINRDGFPKYIGFASRKEAMEYIRDEFEREYASCK